MGLFGLFCSALTGGVFIGDTLRNSSFDTNSKQDAIRRGDITWMDSHGNQYLVSTGEKVFYGSDGKLRSVRTGRIVYDYKKECAKRDNEKAIEKAIAEGEKSAMLVYPEFDYKSYNTELSTMKRIYLETNLLHDGGRATRFYKVYYTGNQKFVTSVFADYKDKKVEITKEEYKLLGGCDVLCEQYAYHQYGNKK